MIDNNLAVGAGDLLNQGGVTSRAAGEGSGVNFADVMSLLLGLTNPENSNSLKCCDEDGAKPDSDKNQLPYWVAMPYTTAEFIPTFGVLNANDMDWRAMDSKLTPNQNNAQSQSLTLNDLQLAVLQKLINENVNLAQQNIRPGESAVNQQQIDLAGWLKANGDTSNNNLTAQQQLALTQLVAQAKQLLNQQQLTPELKQLLNQYQLQQESNQRSGYVSADQVFSAKGQNQTPIGQQLVGAFDKITGQEKPVVNGQPNQFHTTVQQIANNLQQTINQTSSSGTVQQQQPQVDGQEQVNMSTVSHVVDTATGAYKTAATEGTALRTGESTVMAQIARAIIDHVGKDQQGQTNVRLRLHPAELGEVVIRIIYREGNITTHFQAASEQVKQLIESSLPQLRETLTDLEFNLQNASVSVGAEGKNQQHGFKGQPKAQNSSTKISTNDSLSLSDDVEQSSVENKLNYFV